MLNIDKDVDNLFDLAGTGGFKDHVKSLEARLIAFGGQFRDLGEKWPKEFSLDSFGMGGVESKYNSVREKFDNAVKVDKDKTQRKITAANRLKGIAILLLVLAMLASMLFGARCYHDEKNKDTINDISGAISRSEFAKAKSLYDSLVSIKWLGVRNTDHLCSDFEERLAHAAKYYEIRKSSEKYNSKLEGLGKWLDGIEASTKEVNSARKDCGIALKSYKTLPPSPSFAEIVQQRVDIESRILTAQICESSLTNSIDKIEKIQSGWNEYLRKSAFTNEIQEAKKQLTEIDSTIGNLNLTSATNSIEEINRHIGKLQELAGTDEDDVATLEEFKESAGAVLEMLKVKCVERRTEIFTNMLADIRFAKLSNSVSQVWEKYDVAHEFASNEEECGRLEELREEVLGFTIKAFEQKLSVGEKNADVLREESAISHEMIEKTRKTLRLVSAIREGLRRRIPETHDDFKRIESQAKNVQAKLPVIVQIDGILQDDNQPVDIKNAGNETSTILNGISPDTQKQCVYLRVMQYELPTGNSRFVSVVDTASGRKYWMSILLSDFAPGINRVNLKGQLIN